MEKFKSMDAGVCREGLACYESVVCAMGKEKKKEQLVGLDHFYRKDLPGLLRQRSPNPYITTEELSRLMQWKLARGKWRPRLLSLVSSLDDALVRQASAKAFASLHTAAGLSAAVSDLTVLKGVGPATASAVLAAYAPEVAPFMSDEAVLAVLGGSKLDYSLKRYLQFAQILQAKAKEISTDAMIFTPSDVERALWSSTVAATLSLSHPANKSSKRKRK